MAGSSKSASDKASGVKEHPAAQAPPWFVGIGSHEISGLFMGSLALILFLALISYSPRDLPAWVPFSLPGTNSPGSHNLIGPAGVLVAGYAFFFFGAACFLIPAAMAWWAARMMMARQVLPTSHFLALGVFLTASACLIDLQEPLFKDWVSVYNLPRSKGGIIGYGVGRIFLCRAAGPTGAWLLLSIAHWVALMIVTGIHPLQFCALAKRLVLNYCRKIDWKGRSGGLPPGSPPGGDGDLARARSAAMQEFDAFRIREVHSPSGRSSRSGQPYTLPPIGLLRRPDPPEAEDRHSLTHLQNVILDTLKSFHVDVEPGDITKGPAVTRFEFYPAPGLRVNKIIALKADLARATRAWRINILAPVPGKETVGIEIANRERTTVTLRELLEDPEFQAGGAKLPVVLGKDVYGKSVIGDLSIMPHLLVAGATGSGKSVCLNAMIAGLLFRFSPQELQFIMIDPKLVEMQIYNALPHMLAPVVTDPAKAQIPLHWVLQEMERRYALFAARGVRHFEAFNATAGSPRRPSSADHSSAPLPFIVVIIEELADLMQTAPSEVETCLARIAQKSRAAGIHLIMATQTPRADVVTGIIKANIPSRIAFQVSSKTDSRIILDENGAEDLIGKGDMLYLQADKAHMIRVQGVFITDDELRALVHACASQACSVR